MRYSICLTPLRVLQLICKSRMKKVYNRQARQLTCAGSEYFKKENANGESFIFMNTVLEHTASACKVEKNLVVRTGKEKDDLLSDFSDTEPTFQTSNKKEI